MNEPASTIVPADCVLTFDACNKWLREIESFAKKLPATGQYEFYTHAILDKAGQVLIRAVSNNIAGAWKDDRVAAVMNECWALQLEAQALVKKEQLSNQRKQAARKGGKKRSEQAAKEFNRAEFCKDAEALQKKHPEKTKSDIANNLANKYPRSADYLRKLIK